MNKYIYIYYLITKINLNTIGTIIAHISNFTIVYHDTCFFFVMLKITYVKLFIFFRRLKFIFFNENIVLLIFFNNVHKIKRTSSKLNEKTVLQCVIQQITYLGTYIRIIIYLIRCEKYV